MNHQDTALSSTATLILQRQPAERRGAGPQHRGAAGAGQARAAGPAGEGGEPHGLEGADGGEEQRAEAGEHPVSAALFIRSAAPETCRLVEQAERLTGLAGRELTEITAALAAVSRLQAGGQSRVESTSMNSGLTFLFDCNRWATVRARRPPDCSKSARSSDKSFSKRRCIPRKHCKSFFAFSSQNIRSLMLQSDSQ